MEKDMYPFLIPQLPGFALAGAGAPLVRSWRCRPGLGVGFDYCGCRAGYRGPSATGLAYPLACALSGVFLVVQAWLEEIDLLQRLPAYRAYRQQVPGFVPRIRHKQTNSAI